MQGVFKQTSAEANSTSNDSFKSQHHLEVSAKKNIKNYIKITSETTASVKFSITANQSAQPLQTQCCTKPVMQLSSNKSANALFKCFVQMLSSASTAFNFIDANIAKPSFSAQKRLHSSCKHCVVFKQLSKTLQKISRCCRL